MPRGGKRPGAGRKRTRPQPDTAASAHLKADNSEKRIGEGKPGPGRPPGSPNRATAEVKALCHSILSDPKYLKMLKKRAFTGKLHPSVETTLWHYAHGKPASHVSIGAGGEGPGGLRRVVIEVVEEPAASGASA